MTENYKYTPRFKDMRIRPPKEGEEHLGRPEEDVLRLKPGEKPCEWPSCHKAATARAPKSREMINQYYQFCTAHAAEYNKNWNFFAGMSEGEASARRTSLIRSASLAPARHRHARKPNPRNARSAKSSVRHFLISILIQPPPPKMSRHAIKSC